jgi:hypothetical protein
VRFITKLFRRDCSLKKKCERRKYAIPDVSKVFGGCAFYKPVMPSVSIPFHSKQTIPILYNQKDIFPNLITSGLYLCNPLKSPKDFNMNKKEKHKKPSLKGLNMKKA